MCGYRLVSFTDIYLFVCLLYIIVLIIFSFVILYTAPVAVSGAVTL